MALAVIAAVPRVAGDIRIAQDVLFEEVLRDAESLRQFTGLPAFPVGDELGDRRQRQDLVGTEGVARHAQQQGRVDPSGKSYSHPFQVAEVCCEFFEVLHHVCSSPGAWAACVAG